MFVRENDLFMICIIIYTGADSGGGGGLYWPKSRVLKSKTGARKKRTMGRPPPPPPPSLKIPGSAPDIRTQLLMEVATASVSYFMAPFPMYIHPLMNFYRACMEWLLAVNKQGKTFGGLTLSKLITLTVRTVRLTFQGAK